MALSSPFYPVFLAAVWIAVRILRAARSRKFALLAASVIFYALLDLRYLLLLILLGGLTFGLGMAIGEERKTKAYAAAGIIAALSVLAFFKITAGGVTGVEPFLPSGNVAGLLPVGISFYTFQAVSYLVDVRRGRIEPVRDWLDFGLYMAFFPKIIAGPIVRPTDFFRTSVRNPEGARREDLPDILFLFLRGLFKKIVIADALAGLAGTGFQGAASAAGFLPAPIYWRSLYLFAFQIYADFSGYTDIARASGRLLGIPLPENFNRPYAAASITEFWNRWHMSLTQWFREYVFFPANRALLASRRKVRPAIVQAGTTIGTMLLIGLWHGARLPYLAWGLWHGLLLNLEQRLAARTVRRRVRPAACVAVFHLTAAGWIFFRSESLTSAGRFIGGLFAGGQWFLLPECLLPVAAAAAAVWAVDGPAGDRPSSGRGFTRAVLAIAAAAAVAAIWLVQWATGGGGQPFLYGNF